MTSFPGSLRRGVVALGAVAIMGGAAVGIAAAQAQPATPTTGQAQSGYQKFIDALAQRLGTTTAKLETAIGEARTDAGLPAGGQGFPGGRGKGGPRGGGVDLNAAATAIGITPQQLHTELAGKSLADVAKAHGKTAADVATALKNAAHTRVDQAVTAGKIGIDAQTLRTELAGKSLADVAKAHGKNPADVATALKNAAHTSIDQAVTAGKLTADQAATHKTQVDQRIDQQINQVVPQRGTGAGADAETVGG